MAYHGCRTGQAAIEDVKTMAVFLLALVVLGGIVTVLGIINSNLSAGYASVDGARLYSGVAGLAGERHAVVRLNLLNSYDRIQVQGSAVTLHAGFIDGGSFTVALPGQYTYRPGTVSNEPLCIIKRGPTVEFVTHPCT